MVRGRPFEPGNQFGRGRPKGSRNKRSSQAQEILDKYAEPITQKCVTAALRGDVAALRLCLERILPPLREPGVKFALPPGNTLKDLPLVIRKVLQAIARGNVTPAEGERIANFLDHQRRLLEVAEIEPRIEELEQRCADRNGRARK